MDNRNVGTIGRNYSDSKRVRKFRPRQRRQQKTNSLNTKIYLRNNNIRFYFNPKFITLLLNQVMPLSE